ncbi:PSME3-interacting protein-like [Littorina saxatilis]|uniref:PSME3-interacting protein-like n=1 Tax=Littorina saxatilis TaxID=31220 RepID=UPI0038B62F88
MATVNVQQRQDIFLQGTRPPAYWNFYAFFRQCNNPAHDLVTQHRSTMSFGSGSDSFAVKKFETQEEVEEKKKKRQEQWDKVRKPDDPEVVPEEETRSLFQQLQDNQESKDREQEQEFKMRSSVQGLEEEEAKFLDFVSNRQVQLERERAKEEDVVLEQMKEAAVRKATEKAQSGPDEKKPSGVLASTSKKSQQSLLLGAIKRKSTDATTEDPTKRKRSDSGNSSNSTSPSEDKLLKLIDTSKPVAQVAGILPGIGSYDDESSDSQSSSCASDLEEYIKSPKKVIRVQVQQ